LINLQPDRRYLSGFDPEPICIPFSVFERPDDIHYRIRGFPDVACRWMWRSVRVGMVDRQHIQSQFFKAVECTQLFFWVHSVAHRAVFIISNSLADGNHSIFSSQHAACFHWSTAGHMPAHLTPDGYRYGKFAGHGINRIAIPHRTARMMAGSITALRRGTSSTRFTARLVRAYTGASTANPN